MRDALTESIFEKYASLYGGAGAGDQQPPMAFGFEHGDGWFSIIDSLSQVITGHDSEVGGDSSAQQVKEKYGTLSFYAQTDSFGQGAIDMAEAYSGRVCEKSGFPGLPMQDGHWFATLAPSRATPGAVAKEDKVGQVPTVKHRIARDGTLNAMARVVAARGDVLGSVVNLPDGWAELVDVLGAHLAREGWVGDDIVPWRLHGLRVGSDGRLEVLVTGDVDDECGGALAFASEMSARIDKVDGSCNGELQS